jgi:uncharacterized protein
MSKKVLILLVICMSSILMICIALSNDLVVREYSLESEKISTRSGITIVLVTDLHSHIYGENQSYIKEKISEQNPDIIALSGDIGDRNRSIEGAELFIRAIKDIAPIYYVTGNHEFDSGEVEHIKEMFGIYGVAVLESDFREVIVKGQNLVIAGLDDPKVEKHRDQNFNWEREALNAFAGLDREAAYRILLSHRPERVSLYENMPFDLVLSGHAHGGQIRVPYLLNGLFAPNQGFFPKYAGGVYHYGKVTHVVSRGVAYNPFRPRIFNPPEIVVIKLKRRVPELKP